MSNASNTAKRDKAIARIARAAAKLVIQLEAAAQTEAARQVRGDLSLARIDLSAGARASLAERGYDDSLLDASEIRTSDGIATVHAVALA